MSTVPAHNLYSLLLICGLLQLLQLSLLSGIDYTLIIIACCHACKSQEGGGVLRASFVIKFGITGEVPPFRALSGLLVGGNAIRDWKSVDEVDRFPCVSALRISSNPHPSESSAKRYQASTAAVSTCRPPL